MRIIVVGGGIIGATTAHACLRHGHDVTLLEAGHELASVTSFANGGQIAVSESAPWSQPGMPMKMLMRSWRGDAPFRLRLRADPAQWRWLLAFLSNSRAGPHRAGKLRNLALARYSLACLHQTRAELGNDFSYDDRQKGILQLIPAAAQTHAMQRDVDEMAARGGSVSWLSPDETSDVEPALASAVARGLLAGAVWGQTDESGDARLFVARLVAQLTERYSDARFCVRCDTPITGLVKGDCDIRGVMSGEKYIEADRVILAAGLQTRDLLAPLGVRVPMYGVKGYSITIPLDDDISAPETSLTDLKNRLVMSRLGQRLRVAGFAEIGMRPDVEPVRVATMMTRIGELFPDFPLDGDLSPWVGFRPMTPDGAPLIGPVAGTKGLFMNTGHGPLGWTFSHGAAQIIADLVSGKTPSTEFQGFAPDRAMMATV